MKVKFIASLCGGSEDYHPSKDDKEVEDNEALRLIDAGIAIPSSKKEYEQVLARINKKNIEDAEKEAQANAILEKETLIGELRDLYAQVARKSAQIEGIVLTDEEVEGFVEKSMNGEDPAADENFPAGKSKDESSTENSTEKPKDESGTENGAVKSEG